MTTVPSDLLTMMGVCCRLLPFLLPIQATLGLLSSTVTKPSTFLAAHDESGDWQTLGQVAAVTSPWLTVYCERLRDEKDQTLDYWRVEKDPSVICLTLHRDRIVFPKKQYRPGVKRRTLDFAGGRSSTDEPLHAVPGILKRELNVDLEKDVSDLKPLNEKSGWLINSSFSNQQLWAYVATLREELELDPAFLHDRSYAVDDTNQIDELLQNELACLQCRSVLMEYLVRQKWLKQDGNSSSSYAVAPKKWNGSS